MSDLTIFHPLPPERLQDLTGSFEIAFDLISVTLVDGAMLIGALGKNWHWDGNVVSLVFNTEKGKKFGRSHIVDIPVSLIANVQRIPLDKSSIPQIVEDDPQLVFMRELGLTDEKSAKLPVQDYPNPLATIICRHNLLVVASHNLPLLGYVERALSQDALPPQGIFLEEDFLLYVDWDFFSRQTSGGTSIEAGVSIPVAQIKVTKDLSPSRQESVLSRLRDSWAERIRKGLSPKIIQDNLVQGCIFVPEPTEDTEIEGEKCIVTLCATKDEGDESVANPVLIKMSCIKFPLEFLGRVNSVLTFYGEVLPVPLNVMGRSYKSMLLARAIAYLHTK